MGGRDKTLKPAFKGYNKVTFLKGNLWKRFGLQFCHASIDTKRGMKSQTLAVSGHLRLHALREVSPVGYSAMHTTIGDIRRFFCTMVIDSTRSKFTDWWQKPFLALGRLVLKSITLMATRQTTELTTLNGSPIKKTTGTPTGLLMAELRLNTKGKKCLWPRPALGMRSMVFAPKTHAEG
jgi:hypothetical protein